jgi:hypothetical protein
MVKTGALVEVVQFLPVQARVEREIHQALRLLKVIMVEIIPQAQIMVVAGVVVHLLLERLEQHRHLEVAGQEPHRLSLVHRLHMLEVEAVVHQFREQH